MSAPIINSVQTTEKKFSLRLTPTDKPVITVENESTIVKGMGIYEVASDIFEGNNRVIPNCNNMLTGTLELDSDCDTVELESDLSLEEVKKEIMTYLNTHEHARTSDIVFDLNIDLNLVIEALNTLEKEDQIEGKAVKPNQK